MTNKGILIQPNISIKDLRLEESDKKIFAPSYVTHKWALLYFIPPNCPKTCQNALYSMRQVKRSLDRDINRVDLISIQTTESSPHVLPLLNDTAFPFKQLKGTSLVIDNAFSSSITSQASQAGYIYMMSPDGFVFMQYAVPKDEHEAILKARDIRKDLKRTLKGSLIR